MVLRVKDFEEHLFLVCIGSGFRGLGLKVHSTGLLVCFPTAPHKCMIDSQHSGSGFRVQGSGFGVQGSGFRVQEQGLKVKG